MIKTALIKSVQRLINEGYSIHYRTPWDKDDPGVVISTEGKGVMVPGEIYVKIESKSSFYIKDYLGIMVPLFNEEKSNLFGDGLIRVSPENAQTGMLIDYQYQLMPIISIMGATVIDTTCEPAEEEEAYRITLLDSNKRKVKSVYFKKKTIHEHPIYTIAKKRGN